MDWSPSSYSSRQLYLESIKEMTCESSPEIIQFVAFEEPFKRLDTSIDTIGSFATNFRIPEIRAQPSIGSHPKTRIEKCSQPKPSGDDWEPLASIYEESDNSTSVEIMEKNIEAFNQCFTSRFSTSSRSPDSKSSSSSGFRTERIKEGWKPLRS